jgi:carboxymethylenebutenolidase
VQQIAVESFTRDVQAVLAFLREKLGQDVTVFVVGFCMGGSLALITGTNPSLGLAGLIPFYAGLSRSFAGVGTALDNAEHIIYPVEGFFGEADYGIPVSAVHDLDARLDKAGIQHHLTIYPGATHSFFDRRSEEFAAASADAWEKLLAFIQTRHPQAQTA